MNMSRTDIARLLSSLCLAIVLAACQGSREMAFYDTVPADAPILVSADVSQMLKMAGCSYRNGALIPTQQLERLALKCNDIESVLSLGQLGFCLRLESVLAYKSYQGKWVWTAPRIEGAGLPMAAYSSQKSEKIGRYYIYALTDDISLLLTEDQGWVVGISPDEMGDFIQSQIENAIAYPLSASVKDKQFIEGDDPLKVKMTGNVDNPMGQSFVNTYFTVRMADSQWLAKAWCDNANGRANPFDLMQMVDTASLWSMPDGSIASIALGATPAVIRSAKKYIAHLPMKTKFALETLTTMFSPNGGTIAAGMAPGGNAETINNFDFENWIIKVLLPLGDNAEPAAMLINKFSSDKIYCESVDEYLALTNFNPEDYPCDYDASGEMPKGAKIYASLRIPYKSEIMKALGVKQGYECKLWAMDSVAYGSFRILGSPYLMPALIQDLNSLSIW